MAAATVSVSATAEREVDPDGFVVSISVSGDGADAVAARDRLAAHWAELESAVAALGETVQVRRGQVRSWHDAWGKERGPGWRSERMMTLVSDDVRAAADVLGAAERLPEAQVHGPQWQVHADNPAHAELQAAAVHEARTRAERYAAALGTTLGRLVQLRDPGTGRFPHRVVS